jgi:uroporphyrinogen decarboxylase
MQGNLEPAVLLGPADLVQRRARDVLHRAAGRAGHIFNLGHGVPPDASVENLQLLVETVHSWVPAHVA